MFYRQKKSKKPERGGGTPLVRPRVKNPNGTETNQLTIYKRGRGFSRVIQILSMHCKYFGHNSVV